MPSKLFFSFYFHNATNKHPLSTYEGVLFQNNRLIKLPNIPVFSLKDLILIFNKVRYVAKEKKSFEIYQIN